MGVTLKVDKRYLKLPVSAHAQIKKLKFRDEQGKLVYDLDVKLDPAGAQHEYYVDMSRFEGQALHVECLPEIGFEPKMADAAPEAPGGQFRPEAHFTPARGWINDPNGLVFYEGKYHLFYQHNPAGMNWGNMHWGHAASEDLMHWAEKEIALYPDELGTMYSGSAIVDERNISGLKKGVHAPILLFYTAAGDRGEMSRGKEHVQCLAYSLDGGETFEKYAGNPIIDHMVGGNRDPKVIFCPEMNAYVIALYLDGHEFALFRSENLMSWTLHQRIEIPGEGECPDFFPLMLEGETYWVLSGAADFYLIGKIVGGRFEPVQEALRLKSAGSKAYAAQTYSDMPDGRRVRISWNRFELPGMAFNGSMTTPVELYLERRDESIVLCARPVGELEKLYGQRCSGQGCVELPGKANDIFISVPAEAGEIQIGLMGLNLKIDTAAGKILAGGEALRARAEEGQIRLRIVQDVHAMEIFSDHGASCSCIGHLADLSLSRITAPACVWVEAAELKNYRT